MKGVPLRLEIGPRDIENNQCVVVRRDNREKITVSLDELATRIPELLADFHKGLYEKALERRETMTYDAKTLDEIKEIADNKPGFIRAMWCGCRECEDKLKEVAGVTSRCIPFEQEAISAPVFAVAKRPIKCSTGARHINKKAKELSLLCRDNSFFILFWCNANVFFKCVCKL